MLQYILQSNTVIPKFILYLFKHLNIHNIYPHRIILKTLSLEDFRSQARPLCHEDHLFGTALLHLHHRVRMSEYNTKFKISVLLVHTHFSYFLRILLHFSFPLPKCDTPPTTMVTLNRFRILVYQMHYHAPCTIRHGGPTQSNFINILTFTT